MEHTQAQVPTDPGDIRPLMIGSRIPDISLKTADGSSFSLSAALSEKPSLLVFYRGGW